MSHDADFTIDTLASYLHLQPAQVARLVDRGKLPGRKVSGQWRFSPEEIHHWMEERMGVLDDEGLAHVEGILKRTGPVNAEPPLSVAELLHPHGISIFLEARTRNKVITAMTQLAATTGLLWDPNKMADAVRSREDMQPTALDNGVALLHPRRPMPSILGGPLLALGRTSAGIPFGNNSGVLTNVFFLICSTDDQGHLRTLARLSRLVGDATLLAEVRSATNALAVHRIFAHRDAELS